MGPNILLFVSNRTRRILFISGMAPRLLEQAVQLLAPREPRVVKLSQRGVGAVARHEPPPAVAPGEVVARAPQQTRPQAVDLAPARAAKASGQAAFLGRKANTRGEALEAAAAAAVCLSARSPSLHPRQKRQCSRQGVCRGIGGGSSSPALVSDRQTSRPGSASRQGSDGNGGQRKRSAN
jgi:hypothetical protein